MKDSTVSPAQKNEKASLSEAPAGSQVFEIERLNLKRAFGGSLSTVNEDISFEEKASLVHFPLTSQVQSNLHQESLPSLDKISERQEEEIKFDQPQRQQKKETKSRKRGPKNKQTVLTPLLADQQDGEDIESNLVMASKKTRKASQKKNAADGSQATKRQPTKQANQQKLYESCHTKVKKLLDGEEGAEGKSQLLNERICDIDRQIVELVYEKKRCMDLHKSLQINTMGLQEEDQDGIEKSKDDLKNYDYQEEQKEGIELWQYQKDSKIINAEFQLVKHLNQQSQQVDEMNQQKQQTSQTQQSQQIYSQHERERHKEEKKPSNSSIEYLSINESLLQSHRDQDYEQFDGVLEMLPIESNSNTIKQQRFCRSPLKPWDSNQKVPSQATVQKQPVQFSQDSLLEIKDQLFSDESNNNVVSHQTKKKEEQEGFPLVTEKEAQGDGHTEQVQMICSQSLQDRLKANQKQ